MGHLPQAQRYQADLIIFVKLGLVATNSVIGVFCLFSFRLYTTGRLDNSSPQDLKISRFQDLFEF